MQRAPIYRAWGLAVIALLAWAFVLWFAFNLQSTQAQSLSDAQLSASASSRDSAASDLHAALQETASERASLASLITIDPTTLAATINQAGQTAGVNLKIQSASPETMAAGSPVQAFDFTVTAQGTFSQLLYAEQLLETLPVPSSIQNLQLIHAPNDAVTTDGAWQLNAGIQIITSATISS